VRDRLTALTQLLKLDSSTGGKTVGAVYHVHADGSVEEEEQVSEQ